MSSDVRNRFDYVLHEVSGGPQFGEIQFLSVFNDFWSIGVWGRSESEPIPEHSVFSTSERAYYQDHKGRGGASWQRSVGRGPLFRSSRIG